MERFKMRREDRAKQFAPFDALKGLHEELKMKEYEHDRMAKGDVSEEKIMEISKILQEIDKHTLIEVKYFYDGYEKSISGKAIIDIPFQTLKFDKLIIKFDDILDIKVVWHNTMQTSRAYFK